MTVIIITHAREMMAIAEHIIMLEQGRVIEEGGFEELRQKRGEFARLLRGSEWDSGGMDNEGIQTSYGWKGKGKDNWVDCTAFFWFECYYVSRSCITCKYSYYG